MTRTECAEPPSRSWSASGKRIRRTVWMILAVALALRVAPIGCHRLEPDRIAIVDSHRYLQLADQLAAGDGFSWPRSDGTLEPELFRTPGYPVFLALVDFLPGSQDAWVLGLQVVAAVATIALCYWLVSAWASPFAGLLAMVFLALDPAHIVYSNLIMSDVLCGLVIAMGWVLLETSRGHAPVWRLAAAGACLGIATALRPIAVLLALPAAAYLCRRVGCWRQGVRLGLLAFLASALLFPVAWTLRNRVAAGVGSLSTAFDVNLALVVASKVEARETKASRSVAEARVMQRVADLQDNAGLEFHRACRRVAFETLRQSPRAAWIELPMSLTEMLLAGERRYLLQVLGLDAAEGREQRQVGIWHLATQGYSGLERWLVLGQVAFMILVWSLASLGVGTLWRCGRSDVAFSVLMALVVVLGPSLVVGTGRMRLPVAIFIHGLAGIGAAAVIRWLTTRRVDARRVDA